MSYANGRVIHDADSHVMETRDWLAAFADRDAAQVRSLYGKQAEPDRQARRTSASKRTHDAEAAAKAAQKPIAGPKGWIAYGAFEPTNASGRGGLRLLQPAGVPDRRPRPAARSQGRGHALRGRARTTGPWRRSAQSPRLIAVAYRPARRSRLRCEEAARAIAGCGAIWCRRGPPATLARPSGARPVLGAAEPSATCRSCCTSARARRRCPRLLATTAATARPTCTAAARTCASGLHHAVVRAADVL